MNIYKVPFLVALLGLACLAAQELRLRPPGWDIKTNSLVMVYTNGYAEFITMESKTALLRHALTNGEVCAIVGHQWNPYKGMVAYYPEGPFPVLRACSLCRRIEQQATTWSEVSVDQIGIITPK